MKGYRKILCAAVLSLLIPTYAQSARHQYGIGEALRVAGIAAVTYAGIRYFRSQRSEGCSMGARMTLLAGIGSWLLGSKIIALGDIALLYTGLWGCWASVAITGFAGGYGASKLYNRVQKYWQEFDDSEVAGLEESDGSSGIVKLADLGDNIPQEIHDVVAYIRNPNDNIDLGITTAKGFLFCGPPGTGKTLTARAVAGEVGAKLLFVAAPSLEGQYVGGSAAKVRNFFARARQFAQDGHTVIVFIDEIDAIAGRRTENQKGYDKAPLLQLLSELDNVKDNPRIFVFAATNCPQMLDEALVRPGRLGDHIEFRLPDAAQRRDILRRCMNKVTAIDPAINIEELIWLTEGFNCADLDAIVKHAARRVARNRRDLELPDMVIRVDHMRLAIEELRNKKLLTAAGGGASRAGHPGLKLLDMVTTRI